MSGALPFVSVVVPVWTVEELLGTCLTSLARLDYPADRHEILVVGSSLPAARSEVAKATTARYVHAPRRSVSHLRNAGMEASKGEIVAFTDTDCAVSTGWLRALVEPFGDAEVGAVAGAIVPYPPETPAQRFAARRLSHSQLRPLNNPDRPFALTPNIAFRRERLLQCGGFDTSFPGGGWEDADLCWRFARVTGLSLGYAPRAVVFHRYRATAWSFLVQHYRYGRGLGQLLWKYRDELPDEWLEGPQEHNRLGECAWRWGKATALGRFSANGADPTAAKFELLRMLGQRAGLLHSWMSVR